MSTFTAPRLQGDRHNSDMPCNAVASAVPPEHVDCWAVDHDGTPEAFHHRVRTGCASVVRLLCVRAPVEIALA